MYPNNIEHFEQIAKQVSKIDLTKSRADILSEFYKVMKTNGINQWIDSPTEPGVKSPSGLFQAYLSFLACTQSTWMHLQTLVFDPENDK